MERTRQAPAIDVDQLAAQVAQLASNQQLAVVPATPLPVLGSGLLVLLGNNDMSAEDFCKLAATAGARLLYVQAEYFDAESEPELSVEHNGSGQRWAPSASLAELRREAGRFNGRIHQLELAFTAGCVLHCWAVAAEWYADLVDHAGVLLLAEDP